MKFIFHFLINSLASAVFGADVCADFSAVFGADVCADFTLVNPT
jgi:hypothetical protein